MTDRPDMLASSSTPRATSVKNGLATSRTTRPIVRLRPARSWRADSFLTNPRALIAAFTRSRVGCATMSGRFSTLETVPTETPACAATSLMLMGALTDVLPEPDSQFHRRRWNVSNAVPDRRSPPRWSLESRQPPRGGLPLGAAVAGLEPPQRLGLAHQRAHAVQVARCRAQRAGL